MTDDKGATEYSISIGVGTYKSAGVLLLQMRLPQCFAKLGSILATDVGDHIRTAPVAFVYRGCLALGYSHYTAAAVGLRGSGV